MLDRSIGFHNNFPEIASKSLSFLYPCIVNVSDQTRSPLSPKIEKVWGQHKYPRRHWLKVKASYLCVKSLFAHYSFKRIGYASGQWRINVSLTALSICPLNIIHQTDILLVKPRLFIIGKQSLTSIRSKVEFLLLWKKTKRQTVKFHRSFGQFDYKSLFSGTIYHYYLRIGNENGNESEYDYTQKMARMIIVFRNSE